LLEDKDALRSLRDAYHACINDGRYAEITDLRTNDAVVRLGYLARYEGRAQIDAGFKRLMLVLRAWASEKGPSSSSISTATK